MAVAFGSGTNSAFGSSTLNKPASTAAGDLLVIIWFDGGGTATLTGWNSGGHTTEPISGATVGFLWRIADGSEGATFTVAGVGPFQEELCVRYTGTDQTNPINVSNFSTSNNAAIVTVSLNTTVDGCVEICGISFDNGNNDASAPPTGWTKELSNPPGNWYFADRPQATHGATGTQDFSGNGNTGADNETVHIAIAPPSSGATTNAEFGTRVTNPNPFVGPAVLRNRQFSGQHFELPNTNAPLTDTNFEFPQYRNPNVGPTALRVQARQPSLPINIVAPATDTNPGTGTVAPPNPRVGPPALRRHFVQPVNVVNAPATDTNFEFPSYPPGQRFLPAIFRPYPFLPPAPVAPTGASVSVVPATGQLILTGFAPLLDTGLTPGTGSLVLTGFAPVLNTGLTPSTASLVLTGFAPTVATPVTATPSTGTLVLTGFAPTVATPQTFTPTTAALVLTGFAPTITVAPLSTAVSGQFMLLGMG